MAIHFISDLHKDHKKIHDFCLRPEDYEDQIRNAWMRSVKPKDSIFVLGDLFFGKRKSFIEYMNGLPGNKILIRGNHDGETDSWYINNCGFSIVADQMTIMGNIILSHKPIQVGESQYNIHGHLHDISPEYWLKKEGEDYSFLNEYNFNVCPEIIGYAPIRLDRLIKNRVKKVSFKEEIQ